MNQRKDHTQFIVGCVTTLCLSCSIGAIILILKGYDAGGGQMTMAVNSGISGLVGFLARNVLEPRSEINNQGPTNITNQAGLNPAQPPTDQPPTV